MRYPHCAASLEQGGAASAVPPSAALAVLTDWRICSVGIGVGWCSGLWRPAPCQGRPGAAGRG